MYPRRYILFSKKRDGFVTKESLYSKKRPCNDTGMIYHEKNVELTQQKCDIDVTNPYIASIASVATLAE